MRCPVGLRRLRYASTGSLGSSVMSQLICAALLHSSRPRLRWLRLPLARSSTCLHRRMIRLILFPVTPSCPLTFDEQHSLDVEIIKSKDLALPLTAFFGLLPVTKTSSAPNAFASAVLDSPCVIAVTVAPMALANKTPKCPNPPIPTIPTFIAVVPAPYCFKGEYTVPPAHSIGAALARSSPAGMGMANCDGPRQKFAYPPCVF